MDYSARYRVKPVDQSASSSISLLTSAWRMPDALRGSASFGHQGLVEGQEVQVLLRVGFRASRTQVPEGPLLGERTRLEEQHRHTRVSDRDPGEHVRQEPGRGVRLLQQGRE